MTNAHARGGIEILLVEDSPTDRLIAIEALQQARIITALNVGRKRRGGAGVCAARASSRRRAAPT